MCIFDSKEGIEIFVDKVARIASEHNMPVSNSALLLLKSFSLYLHFQCDEDDWTLLSISKLLACCDSVGSKTIFETMLSFPNVKPEVVQAYERFIATVNNSHSQEYYNAVVECQSVMTLCCDIFKR